MEKKGKTPDSLNQESAVSQEKHDVGNNQPAPQENGRPSGDYTDEYDNYCPWEL
jgi:hypothetical protein